MSSNEGSVQAEELVCVAVNEVSAYAALNEVC